MLLTVRECPHCQGKGKMLEVYGSQDFEQNIISCPFCLGEGEQHYTKINGEDHIIVSEDKYKELLKDGFSSLMPILD